MLSHRPAVASCVAAIGATKVFFPFAVISLAGLIGGARGNTPWRSRRYTRLLRLRSPLPGTGFYEVK